MQELDAPLCVFASRPGPACSSAPPACMPARLPPPADARSPPPTPPHPPTPPPPPPTHPHPHPHTPPVTHPPGLWSRAARRLRSGPCCCPAAAPRTWCRQSPARVGESSGARLRRCAQRRAFLRVHSGMHACRQAGAEARQGVGTPACRSRRTCTASERAKPSSSACGACSFTSAVAPAGGRRGGAVESKASTLRLLTAPCVQAARASFGPAAAALLVRPQCGASRDGTHRWRGRSGAAQTWRGS